MYETKDKVKEEEEEEEEEFASWHYIFPRFSNRDYEILHICPLHLGLSYLQVCRNYQLQAPCNE